MMLGIARVCIVRCTSDSLPCLLPLHVAYVGDTTNSNKIRDSVRA